jgi:TrpR family trp operon transcriptional repressor
MVFGAFKIGNSFMSSQGWQHFLDLCLSAKDRDTLAELFELFFTFEEKSSIETRCLIVKALLGEKTTQREIAKNFNVSIAKITRGSNELKRISPKLLRFLQKYLLQE